MREIKNVIMIVHGTHRSQESYYRSVYSSLNFAKTMPQDILILSPQFLIPEDFPKSGNLFWNTKDDWKTGKLSTHKFSMRINSFEIIDKLINVLLVICPNMKRLKLIGHDSGFFFFFLFFFFLTLKNFFI